MYISSANNYINRSFALTCLPIPHVDALEHQKTYCPSKGYKVRPLKMIKQRTNCGRGKSALLFGFLGSPRVQLARQCLLLALGSSPLSPAGSWTNIKRLTQCSEASLHTSPQTVKQITPPHPKAQTSPYPRKKQKMLPTIPKSVHSAMNPQHFLGILLFFIYLIWTIFFQKIFDFLPLMCYNNLYRE